MSRFHNVRAVPVLMALALAFLGSGLMGAAAAPKDKPNPPPIVVPSSAQVISGNPMKITVLDNTQMAIEFTNAIVGQNQTQQFYGSYADGIFLWAAHDSQSSDKVFGPDTIQGGHSANAYTAVSNTLTGVGTPADPWIVTTVNDVPGTKLRLTQQTSYVNGAEYVKMTYKLEQMGGTEVADVYLFHAADVRAGEDEMATGYYDTETGAVGDSFASSNHTMYQQFIPLVPVDKYQEGAYSLIWDKIGDASGCGPGFDNSIVGSEPHDAGMGLQWELNVPTQGAVTVGDTVLLGPHQKLAGSFSDVPSGSYYYDTVYYVGTHGIATGYSDGTFRPLKNATRAQLAKMIVQAEGWPIEIPPAFPHFVDVPETNDFFPYVETAYAHGIINGFSDLTFRPNANVTRGQAMKMVVLAKQWTIDTTGGPHFADVPVGSPYYDYIETAYQEGIIAGYSDGKFRVNNNAIRAQISKILALAQH
jgi:hypothetical protein